MALLMFLRGFFLRHAALALENAALREQIAVLTRSVRRPKLRRRDRAFWVLLSYLWRPWRSVLLIARPTTVLQWHRAIARWLWRRRSPGPIGRPPIPMKVIWMIKRLSKENPLWGAPRIQSELWLLGIQVSEWTVNKYMVRPSDGTRSQSWKAFLANHRNAIAACDFFTVTTATFQKLQAFVVMSLDRRRILHAAATRWSSGEWVAQEIAKADLPRHRIRFLISDNDLRFRAPLSVELETEQLAPRTRRHGIVNTVPGALCV